MPHSVWCLCCASYKWVTEWYAFARWLTVDTPGTGDLASWDSSTNPWCSSPTWWLWSKSEVEFLIRLRKILLVRGGGDGGEEQCLWVAAGVQGGQVLIKKSGNRGIRLCVAELVARNAKVTSYIWSSSMMYHIVSAYCPIKAELFSTQAKENWKMVRKSRRVLGNKHQSEKGRGLFSKVRSGSIAHQFDAVFISHLTFLSGIYAW